MEKIKCDVCEGTDFSVLETCYICNRSYCELCDSQDGHEKLCELCKSISCNVV